MSKANYRLSQIILYVNDMATEVHFYRDLLGLPVVYPKDKSDFSGEMWVELDAGGFSLALHGGAAGPPCSEHELVFIVDDLTTAWHELGESGDYVDKLRTLETDEPIITGHDPEGHRFSIRKSRKD